MAKNPWRNEETKQGARQTCSNVAENHDDGGPGTKLTDYIGSIKFKTAQLDTVVTTLARDERWSGKTPRCGGPLRQRRSALQQHRQNMQRAWEQDCFEAW